MDSEERGPGKRRARVRGWLCVSPVVLCLSTPSSTSACTRRDLDLVTYALAHGYPAGSVIHRVLSPLARAGGPLSSTAAVQVRASRLIAFISDSRVRSTPCSRAMT
jgi:hypothetical protein